MLLKIFILLLSIGLICFGTLTLAQDQNDDETMRGGFLNTRPSKAGSSTKNKGIISSKNNSGTGKSVDGKRVDGGSDPLHKTIIGLGYTLYQCNANGRGVRIDPSREFSAGDAIRITLEPNTNGYLYIFHTENDSQPQMIFPDVRLQKGNNAIRAHVPYEVPSSRNPDPNLQWFFFDEKPATERLYVVVTRQPLPDVPIGEKLINYCRMNKEDCPWRPPSKIWAEVQAKASEQTIVSKSKTQGEVQSSTEREAINRGLHLSKTAPSPSVICMSASSDTEVLVTSIDLIHK